MTRPTFAIRCSVIALLASLSACADHTNLPLSPDVTPSSTVTEAGVSVTDGFYFAPPLAPVVTYGGTFDGEALTSLAVAVCPLNQSGSCASAPVVYDQSTQPALTLDAESQTYGVTWKPGTIGDYRISVHRGSLLLGTVDIRAESNGRLARAVPEGYVGMVANAALPIRFRVERRAPEVILDLARGYTFTQANDLPIFAARVIGTDGVEVVAPAIVWNSLHPDIATVDPMTGRVTAPASGVATITATYEGVTATGTLTVYPTFETPIASATVPITRQDQCGNSAGRRCETLIGNVIADAFRNSYGTDFGFMISDGIRADLTCPTAFGCTGVLTPGTITALAPPGVLPFGNRVVTVTLTGAEVKAMLENGVAAAPAVSGAFLQVSGLCFTYSLSAPIGSRVSGAVRQAADGSCTGPAVNLTASASYTVAMDSFMAGGGNGYANVASRGAFRAYYAQVLYNWVIARSPITASIQGRIVELP